MAGADESDRPDMEWHVRLNGVERLDREEGDEGDVFYDVEFELSAPGMTGTLSAMVVDPVHETTIITEAVDMLLVGLEKFAAAVRLQMKPSPVEPVQS